MLQKIIEKLDSIPIFFEKEKEYILEKIQLKSSSELIDIYDELCSIENNVENDRPVLNEKIKLQLDSFYAHIEEKKRKVINSAIENAENKDKEEVVDPTW